MTGARAEGWEFDASHWARNLREPVQFGSAVARLIEDRIDAIVELGPQPVLAGSIVECAQRLGRAPLVLASLRHGQSERAAMLSAAGSLYALGAGLSWRRMLPAHGRVVSLPAYPWQRERHWIGPVHRASPAGVAPDPEGTATDPVDEWFFDVAWEPHAEPAEGDPAIRPADWLVVGGESGVGWRLAEALRARGHRVSLASRAAILDPASRERLFAESFGPDEASRYVIYAAERFSAPAAQLSADALEKFAVDACAEVQALVRQLVSDPTARLWIVTEGAEAVSSDDAPSVEQAPLWGLARSLALEHPPIWGGIVDLDSSEDRGIALLGGLMASGRSEEQVAVRRGTAYVARLVRSPLRRHDRPGFVLRHDASYVVAGGLGALGVKLPAGSSRAALVTSCSSAERRRATRRWRRWRLAVQPLRWCAET